VGRDGRGPIRVNLLPMMHSVLALAMASAPPCTSAITACAEWVAINGQESRLLVYRTHSLAARNERLTRALVFVHGINRDADNHFRTALAAAFLDGATADTVIVAPRFASNSHAPGMRAAIVAILWRRGKQTGFVKISGQIPGVPVVLRSVMRTWRRSISWMKSFAVWPTNTGSPSVRS
jgi:hypothetical protein